MDKATYRRHSRQRKLLQAEGVERRAKEAPDSELPVASSCEVEVLVEVTKDKDLRIFIMVRP